MLTQQALHLSLAEGHHDLVQVDAPCFLGPVEYAWSCRDDNDPTVLGVGPFAGTPVPGGSSLVIAGRSPLWDGFHATTTEGAGLALAGLGCHLIALRGRAPKPSLLVVTRRAGKLEVRIEPLDPEPIWRGSSGGSEGTFALVRNLAACYAGELGSLGVLAVGPAAARTRMGAICTMLVDEGIPSPVHGWLRRGGFGSRLFQTHGLCAVVIGGDETTAQTGARLGSGDNLFLDRFRRGMSIAELEAAVGFEFSPKLKAWGSLGATFNLLRQRALWFNSSSVHFSEEERDDLYRRALREHYLAALKAQATEEDTHRTCGEPCPLASRKLVGGQLKEFESYAALGPQIGVADTAAADGVVERCEVLGFDALAAGGVLGWLMEQLASGLQAPAELGLPADARPRWSGRGFDPVADSRHNAGLARALLDQLLSAPWAEPLARGLRHAARGAGGAAAALAVYNANGETGEMIPPPFWAPGFFTPVPIAGEFHQYYGLEFVPPRVLGRKSAQRMTAELMLQNFGVCRLQRWAEEHYPDLVNRFHGTSVDWAAHHRALAHAISQRKKARFWETERVVDIVARFIQNYYYDAAPDPELDRWVRRFRQDKASAARAYWSEVNAGLEEMLGH
jgi:glyceraldehyde-3-phosphate dehydrogenase (ferredoxin)